ncbi:MAG: zinc ribbon domain-containing protein [Prevotella sp.]|nr:zinc ribbon domain-containing protein [Prevotella sp.]
MIIHLLKHRALSPICFLLILMTSTLSCRHQQAAHQTENDSVQFTKMDSIRADSLEFRRKHHYTENYNFQVISDSLPLQVQIPEEAINNMPLDTFYVTKDELLVVADIRILPADSIDSVWIQLARNNSDFGWVHEKQMLASVVPDDSISQFIYFFSNKHLLIFLIMFVVVILAYGLRKMFSDRAHVVHFKDIATFYPTMLCITVACAATIFTSIQMFVPEQWQEFYYHPSLNPFSHHWPMALFIASVWMIIIMIIATIDDCLRHLSMGEAIPYMFGVAALCALNYVIFTFTTSFYLGYLLLALYICWAVYRYLFKTRSKYICGNCGKQIKTKGKCPYCGVINE